MLSISDSPASLLEFSEILEISCLTHFFALKIIKLADFYRSKVPQKQTINKNINPLKYLRKTQRKDHRQHRKAKTLLFKNSFNSSKNL